MFMNEFDVGLIWSKAKVIGFHLVWNIYAFILFRFLMAKHGGNHVSFTFNYNYMQYFGDRTQWKLIEMLQ